MIELETGGVEAYLATPDAAPARGGVLFFTDAFGLRPRIAEMADEIASWGYVVLAPNIFHRSGDVASLMPTTDLRDPANRADFLTQAHGRIAALTPERFAADAPGYLAALHERSSGPAAAIGFCMGARLAVRIAGHAPDDIVAVGGFHGGGLVTDDANSPHHSIPGTSANYLFLHADQDQSMTPDHVNELERTLRETGVEHVNQIVPGAPHGYTMSDTSAWDAAAHDRYRTALRELLDQIS